MADDMVAVIREDEARVNVTFADTNGDLPQPVFAQSSDADIKAWVTEAVRNGGIPGINANAGADFRDYVVDRFPPTEARPYNLIQVRPKTAFGIANAGTPPAFDSWTQMGGGCRCPNCGNVH